MLWKRDPNTGFSLVNIPKSLRAFNLKIICEWLPLPLEVFCEDFFDFSYGKCSI